jgi:multidrug efflux pump subunit AcrA (membrane-fusion protein)
VDEGQDVKAGQLIAVIESDDLEAARKAAEATATSQDSSFQRALRLSARTAEKRGARRALPKLS